MAVVDFMFRVPRLPTDDMLLTTCPKCQHNFPLPAGCCQPQQVVVSVVCPRRGMTLTGGGLVTAGSRPAESLVLQKATSGGTLTVNCGGPEPSPSAPIAFTIPATPWTLPPPAPDTDLERLSATVKALRTAGWYYEGLSWQESSALLAPTAPGTFLVRDSSDPRFLFSLSVQTERGPTSVRLHYHEGHFRLDAAPKLVPVMPVFRCVVALVDYYVAVTNDRSRGKGAGKEQVWIDCSGQTYSSILLRRPLYQRGRLPSLQHLARLAIHRADLPRPRPPLPDTLAAYLADYPYSH